MSPSSSSDGAGLRTIAFGTLPPGVWGLGWFPQPEAGALLLGTGAEGIVVEATLVGADDDAWRLSAPGAELLVAPSGEPVDLPYGEGSVGFEQLCTITGVLTLAGGEMAVEAPGRRGERVAETPLQRLDSIREVSAWFGSGDGVTAIALRPRKHKGHEQDEVSAAVLGDAPWPPITDPRLSTTYSTDGRPTRFNLELWSEDPEHFPRRVAGEVIGAGAEVSSAGWQLRAELLQCHSRGEEGPGVYVVGRPA